MYLVLYVMKMNEIKKCIQRTTTRWYLGMYAAIAAKSSHV